MDMRQKCETSAHLTNVTCEVKGELPIFRIDIDAVSVDKVVEEVRAHFKVNVRLPVPNVPVGVVGVSVLISDAEDIFSVEVVVLVSVDVPGDGGFRSAKLSQTA